jgi:putative transposase
VARALSASTLPRGVRRTLVHFTVRHGAKTDATIIFTVLGVDLEGRREVLALRACAEESKDGWSCLLQDLRTRGITEIDLIVGFRARWTPLGALFSVSGDAAPALPGPPAAEC